MSAAARMSHRDFILKFIGESPARMREWWKIEEREEVSKQEDGNWKNRNLSIMIIEGHSIASDMMMFYGPAYIF